MSALKKPSWFQDPGPATGFTSSKDRAASRTQPSVSILSQGFISPKKRASTRVQPKLKAENANNQDLDPYGNYYFALSIDNIEVAHFNECSGLKSSCTIFEIDEGGLNDRVHLRPGPSKWEKLVLRYATSASHFMFQWRDMFLNNDFWVGDAHQKMQKPAKKDYYRTGALTVRDNRGDVIRRYSFAHAWPVSWEGPSFSSDGSALAIECLELAHDGLKISNS